MSTNFWAILEGINQDVTPERPTAEIMDRLIALIPLVPANVLRPTGKFPKTFFHSQYGTDRLRDMCYRYALAYEGEFSFMNDMHAAAAMEGKLTPNQAVAVLNVMVNDYKKGKFRQQNKRRP